MSAGTFIAFTGATAALTAPLGTVASSATANTVKTILQLRPSTTTKVRIIEWGYGFDTAPANNIRVELIETGSIYATVTAHVSGGIMPWADAGASSTVQLGTTHTGYNASAEGTITSTRLFDYAYENGLYYKKQFPLGREPEIGADKALRVRVTPTTSSAVNCWAYIVWEE